MFKKTPLASAVHRISIAGALAALAVPTIAQQSINIDSQESRAIEEIVVTGSRIKRQDFESNSPVATLESAQIDLTGTVNTESLLNTLPQAVPGLDRTSNNPGNGTATVDLRGLGSNRTLVLMNGTRVVPTTQGGSVDINNIPTALIERIEVLTGGASAVYGTDAVAGVVNFILKDDFEGFEISFATEQTGEGDAGIDSVDLTMGANFEDGRGNVVLNLSYTDREALFQRDRSFSNFAQFDDVDANGNPILINGGSSGIPATAIFNGGLTAFSPNTGIVFEPDGSVRPFNDASNDNDFYNFAPVNYIQLPQERSQATALGRYTISENAEAYGRMLFTSSKVPQQLAPTPIFQSTTFTLDGSPFLTPAAQQILSDGIGDGVDTDGDGIDDTASALVRRRLLEVGPRVSDDEFSSFQLQAGIRGDFGSSTWTYDAYISQGRVSGSTAQLGNVNTDRFDQALLLDLSDPTGATCADPGFNGATVPCSPINIFGEGNISEQGAAFLRTAVAATFNFDQDTIGVNFSGELFDLPAGPVGAAFGYEQIDNSADFRPSQDLAAGTIAGFNGSPAQGGSFKSDSYYGEVLVPLIRDLPFVNSMDIELAYRTADYTTVGSVDALKVAFSWEPIDRVRFRAGFNEAVRAPSINELFSPQGEGFPGSQDPCAAEGAPTPAVAAICQATGVPASAVGSLALNLPAGQVRELSGGNPNLIEESADTFSYGVVVSPLDNLTFSLDFTEIEIKDAIASFGGGGNNVLQTCYDPTDPTGGIGSDFCNAITRRPDGSIDFVSTTSQNVASITLDVIDLIASYDTELLGGDLTINYIATFTNEADLEPFDGAQVIECAGHFGNDCGEPIPDYKHRMSFGWTKDDLTAQLLWRHVGKSTDDDDDTLYFAEKLDAENYFDVVASYRLADNYTLTLGIDNLFDTEPPILGDNQEQANTYPATYDVFGRTFYFNAVAKF